MRAIALRTGSPGATVWFAALLGLCVAAGLLVPMAGPRVALLVLGGLLAVCATMYAPGVLFALYLLIPFYKGAVQPLLPVDITIVLAGLNMLQLGGLAFGGPERRVSPTAVGLWLGLALLVMAGVLYAPDQRLALDHAVAYWILVFVPLAAGALRIGSDPRLVRQLLWTFFAMGVVTTVVGVPSFSSSERLAVLGANTINVASAALLVPLLGLTFVAREGTAKMRIATIVLIPAALIVALATGSRGPILVFLLVAVPAVVRGLAHLRSRDLPRIVAVAGAALAIVVTVSLASNSLPALSTTRFTSLGEFVASALTGDVADSGPADTSSTARVAFFRAAASMFEERPLLGFGTAGFEAVSHRLLGETEAYPHNAVLQFAAELGLVGLAFFLALVVLGLARRIPKEARPVRILFVYFLLEAMLGGDIFSDRTTWGLLLVILLMEVPSLARGADPMRAPREPAGLAVRGPAA